MRGQTLLVVAFLSFSLLITLYLLPSLRKSYKKYQSNVRFCKRQNLASKDCDLFTRHRRYRYFQRFFEQWVSFAERHRIPYVLACGTLLGQFRAKEIIPWDRDIDVYVDVKYYQYLTRLAEPRNFFEGSDDFLHFVVQPEFALNGSQPRRWSCDGRKVEEKIDACSFVDPMARLIHRHDHVDVFAVDTRKGLVYDDKGHASYEYSDFYPPVNCTFMNVSTWCPRNSKAILKKYYDSLKPQCNCVSGKWTASLW